MPLLTRTRGSWFANGWQPEDPTRNGCDAQPTTRSKTNVPLCSQEARTPPPLTTFHPVFHVFTEYDFVTVVVNMFVDIRGHHCFYLVVALVDVLLKFQEL